MTAADICATGPVIMNIAADKYRIASIAPKGSVKKIWAIRDFNVSKREVK